MNWVYCRVTGKGLYIFTRKGLNEWNLPGFVVGILVVGGTVVTEINLKYMVHNQC